MTTAKPGPKSPQTAAEMAAALQSHRGWALDQLDAFGASFFRPGEVRIELYGASATDDELVLHVADRAAPDKRGPDLVIARPEGFSFVPATGFADGFAIARAQTIRWAPTAPLNPPSSGGQPALDVRWGKF